MPDSTFFLSPDFPLWTFGFLVVSMVGAVIGQAVGQYRTESLEENGQGATMGAAVKLFFAALVFGALGIGVLSFLAGNMQWNQNPAKEVPVATPSPPVRQIPLMPPGEGWRRLDLSPRAQSSLIPVPIGMRVEGMGDPHLIGAELVDGSTCWHTECPRYADMRGVLILNPSGRVTITVYYRLAR